MHPAIQFSLQKAHISADEAKILQLACEYGEFKAGDLQTLFPQSNSNRRTYQIKKLLEQKYIVPLEENARIYIPNFAQSYLIRGVIDALKNNEFIGGLE